ncbi:hypothetical protein BH09CHL1_BH09CHL1_29030 [soil metagenome]
MRSRIESHFHTVVDSLSSIGLGIAEALIVILFARYTHRFVRRWLLSRLDSPGLSETGKSTIGTLITVSFGVVTGTALLAMWGATWSSIITALSLGTVGILLGIQDILRSLIGGMFLIIERPYSIGDRIKVRDITGRVIAIELRTTVLRSDEGHRIVAPNSIVFSDTMTNYDRRRQMRTSLMLVGITGTVVELRSTIRRELLTVNGVDETLDVRIRMRGVKTKAPLRDRLNGVDEPDKGISRPAEARISWLGGGETEVQYAVIARLKEVYPHSSIRAASVSGTTVSDYDYDYGNEIARS